MKLSDIAAYFREFYEARRTAGLTVEKSNSLYAKGGYTDAQAQRNKQRISPSHREGRKEFYEAIEISFF